MDNPIRSFLQTRKDEKLKKIKDDDFEKRAEIEAKFELETWLTDAAKRAKQLSLVSHPGKFSHPDAKITPTLFQGTHRADGYLRTGNARAQHDVVGNAAALDVYAFLSQTWDDKTLLQHFEDATPELKQSLGAKDDLFNLWRDGFLAIKQSDPTPVTHGLIKQVYFPVGNDYHLLSPLAPSGLMSEHRQRLREIKFSETSKAARSARFKKEPHDTGYMELPHLLTQRFGGTKPQNISKLNSNNGGEAWLMPCIPPALSPKHQFRPKSDFFRWVRADEHLNRLLKTLSKHLHTDYTNAKIREARRQTTAYLFEWILQRAQQLQFLPAGWSDTDTNQLISTQKLWLDSAHFDQREDQTDWQDQIVDQITHWVIAALHRYQESQVGKVIKLGQEEHKTLIRELNEYLQQNKEFLS